MQRHQILAVIISSIGVAGESYVLWHALVNTYPFKVFTYPSPQFFATLANVLAPGLFAAFTLGAIWWSHRSPIATPLLVTMVLPVVFAAAVAVVTVVSHGVRVPAGMGNFDGYTILQALGDLTFTALWLSTFALILGSLSSALVALMRHYSHE